MSELSRRLRQNRRNIILLIILILGIYIIVPQIGRLQDSLTIIRHLNFAWIAVAIVLALATYGLAAGSYYVLAKKHIKYPRTIVVQGAGMLANHILPAGIGNIGVNFDYLRKNKHSRIEAGSVIAVNNTLGFVGHVFLLTSVLLITHTSSLHLVLPRISKILILIGLLIILLAVTIALSSRKVRSKIRNSIGEVWKNIASYQNRPWRVLIALLCSMILTTFYALCMYCCVRAVGANISFAQSLIVLTIGVAGSTITPTPGGLIGVEAGLAAGLLACGLGPAVTVAVVLAYRFVTYWFAILFGIASFLIAERRRYI